MRSRRRHFGQGAAAAAVMWLALGALAWGAPVRQTTAPPPQPVDSSDWRPETRALYRRAVALRVAREQAPTRLRQRRDARLATLPLDTLAAVPASVVTWRPWRAAAERAVQHVARATAGEGAWVTGVPTVFVVPIAVWDSTRRDGFAILHGAALHDAASGVPSEAAIARGMGAAIVAAVHDRLPASRRPWLAALLDPSRDVHGAAWDLLASGGLDGMRRCATGDVERCVRLVAPTAEDSATGFMGDRDVRAATLADTFPRGAPLKDACAMGAADACWRWVRAFHPTPPVALPGPLGASLLAVAVARGGPGALGRFLTPDPDDAAVLVRVAGEPLPVLVAAWRDTVAAAGRRQRAPDGRLAWLGASTIGILLLGTVGVRRGMA